MASRLDYPYKSVYQDWTDYVEFTFYKYKPPFDQTNSAPESGEDLGKSLNIYNSTGIASNLDKITVGGFDKILMYMPEDIQAQYSTDWGGKSFTNIAADALRTSAMAAQGSGGIQGVIDSITNASQRIPSLAAQGIADAINALPGGIGGNVSIQDVLQGTTGVVLNPNVELMFSGFGLRNFSLNFKMTPRDGNEAKAIRNIISCFKSVALPSYGAAPQMFSNVSKIFKPADAAGSTASGGSGPTDSGKNYIAVPNLCQVVFKKGKDPHPFLPLYKVCAITGIDVNYTPDGSYATYYSNSDSNGSPVATTLSLNFSETKLVYSNEITFNGATY